CLCRRGHGGAGAHGLAQCSCGSRPAPGRARCARGTVRLAGARCRTRAAPACTPPGRGAASARPRPELHELCRRRGAPHCPARRPCPARPPLRLWRAPPPPTPPAGFFAPAAPATPLLALIVAYLRVTQFDRSISFAAFAVVLAAGYFILADRFDNIPAARKSH